MTGRRYNILHNIIEMLTKYVETCHLEGWDVLYNILICCVIESCNITQIP